MLKTLGCLAAALLVSVCTLHAATFDVVVGQKPATTIVIPDEPLPVVTAAAEELQYHVRKATSAELPIVREAAAPAGPGHLYLGPCRATGKLGLKLAELQPNAFVMRSVGGNLYLVGDDSPGDVFWILHGNRTRVGTLFLSTSFWRNNSASAGCGPGPSVKSYPHSRAFVCR